MCMNAERNSETRIMSSLIETEIWDEVKIKLMMSCELCSVNNERKQREY